MHPRLRLAAATLVIATVAALATVAATGRPSAPPRAPGFAGALAPPGLPVMGFHLRDQDGAPASLAQYRGRVTILTFMYSTCQDTCPVMAQQIRGALDDLPQPVPTLTVSVDPTNDTPLNARRFVQRASLTGRMRFLLGTRAQLARVWHAYAIAPQLASSRGSDHSSYVFVLDRSGRERVGFPLDQLTPDGLAHDVRLLQRHRV